MRRADGSDRNGNEDQATRLGSKGPLNILHKHEEEEDPGRDAVVHGDAAIEGVEEKSEAAAPLLLGVTDRDKDLRGVGDCWNDNNGNEKRIDPDEAWKRKKSIEQKGKRM